MVLRPGAKARRIATGGHRAFAVTPSTQLVKTSGRDVLTRLHDHEAAAAGVDHHPGDHRITLGVTGARATARRLGTQPSGHMHAEIAAHTGVAGAAICHGLTVGPVGGLDLPDGRPGMASGHPAALALAELRAQEQSCHGSTQNPALSSAARRS